MSFLKRFRHDEPEEQTCPRCRMPAPGDATAAPSATGTSTRPTTHPTRRPRPTGSEPRHRGGGARGPVGGRRRGDGSARRRQEHRPDHRGGRTQALDPRQPFPSNTNANPTVTTGNSDPKTATTDRSPSRVAAV